MREIQDSQLSQSRQLLPSRRALLAGAGVTCAAMLAGCATHDVPPATSGTATSAGGSAPAAGYADLRTPVRGLYQAGSATHGGGGVTGIPGRNVVRQVLTDRRAERWRRRISRPSRAERPERLGRTGS